MRPVSINFKHNSTALPLTSAFVAIMITKNVIASNNLKIHICLSTTKVFKSKFESINIKKKKMVPKPNKVLLQKNFHVIFQKLSPKLYIQTKTKFEKYLD